MTKKNLIYKKALKHYGLRAQVVVAIEELSELQKELTKFLRRKADYDHIAEELADCEIVIEQLKQFFELQPKVMLWKEQKLRRLQSRIDLNTEASQESLKELQEKFS